MSRLFISSKEIDFINDIGKEFVKDVVGQHIIYYPISTMKTLVHPIYDEAVKKIFENPIRLDILAGQPERSTVQDMFGIENAYTFEMFVQARDLIDKGFQLSVGDYFQYDDAIYEIVNYLPMGNIFGQEEYTTAYKINSTLARPGSFDPKQFFLPTTDTSEPYQQSPVTHEFEQSRGRAVDSEGNPTGDIRQIPQRLGEDMVEPAFGKPAKVVIDETGKASDIYRED